MSKYYAVIDTNVIVSGMLKANSVPGTILELVFNGMIVPIYNEEIIQEYKEVLSRPKFKINKAEVEIIIDALKANGQQINQKLTDEELPDPKDVVFYEVTLAALDENDTKLVTGNIKHFPDKRFVVTPRQMLDLIISEN